MKPSPWHPHPQAVIAPLGRRVPEEEQRRVIPRRRRAASPPRSSSMLSLWFRDLIFYFPPLLKPWEEKKINKKGCLLYDSPRWENTTTRVYSRPESDRSHRGHERSLHGSTRSQSEDDAGELFGWKPVRVVQP